MKIEMLSAAVAVMAAGTLAAVTVGPDWCVAYPESGSKDVNRVLQTHFRRWVAVYLSNPRPDR